MAFLQITNTVWYTCFSTDQKQTSGIYRGSRLFELDTAYTYMFDGTNWQQEVKEVNVNHRQTSLSENSGLVTIDDRENGIQIVPANSNRHYIHIQNNNDKAVLISFKSTISTTEFQQVLAAGSGLRLGDGGFYDSYTWKLEIRGLIESAGSTSLVSVFEEEIL